MNEPPSNFGGLENAQKLFGEHWGSGDTIPVRWLIVALLIMLALLAPFAIMRWYRRHHLRSRPLITFHRLASHVGLGLRDQWLLLAIARHESLPSPLTLLLSRMTLHHHARRYAQPLIVRRRLAVMRRIAAMRRMLYD